MLPTLCRNTLARALALALIAPVGAFAQTAPDQPAEKSEKPKTTELEKVVVTGSRIKRAEIEGPAPVAIITGVEMEKQGFNTVYDALTTMTEVLGTVESDIQWGKRTVNVRALNLRNLGPGRSLLLINGHRVADYPLPYGGKSNLASYNNIPAGAVDRIEILTSGASAIYGSDAIAGVVNVILKKDYSGDEIKLRDSTSSMGGRDQANIDFGGGRHGDNWSVTYALEYIKRQPLYANERPYMDSEFDAPRPSWGPEQVYFNSPSTRPSTFVRLTDGNTGLRLTPPPGSCDAFNGEATLFQRQFYDRNSGTVSNRGSYCAATAVFGHWTLNNGEESGSGYIYGTYKFANDIEGWAAINVWRNTGKSMTFMPADALLSRSDGTWFDPGITSAANPNGTLMTNSIRRFIPSEIGGLGPNALTYSFEKTNDISAGLKGTLFNDRFDWDAFVNRSIYRVDEKFPTLIDSKFDDFFLGPQLGTTSDGTPIYKLNQNRWWYPITPKDFANFSTRGENRAFSYMNQASASISTTELFQDWAGPVGFAAVVEAGKQGYALHPDPNTYTPSVDNPVYFTPFGNVDQGGGSRNRYAAGAEFKVPLLSNLTTSLAGRYDKYDAVRSAGKPTGDFGIEYRPLDTLLLRGSYSTVFRAPDMHFVYATAAVNYINQNDITDVYKCISNNAAPACTDQNPTAGAVAIQRKGTPDLNYETGKTWTYGFVWDVIDNLSASVDYWNIRLKNQIDDIGVDTVLADEAGCRTGKTKDGAPYTSHPQGSDYCKLQISRVHRNAAGEITAIETGPINRAQRYVDGFDISLKYRLPTDHWGDFRFAANYSNLKSLRTREFATDPLPNTRYQEPQYKVRASVDWAREQWDATMYGFVNGSVPTVRYGGCTPFSDGFVPSAANNCADNDKNSPTYGQSTHITYQRITAAVVVNARVGYKFNPDMKLEFFVDNVFNKVNKSKDPYAFDFAFIADRIYSVVGREYALQFNWKFD